MFRSCSSVFYEQLNVSFLNISVHDVDVKVTEVAASKYLWANTHVWSNGLIIFIYCHIFETPFKEQHEREKKHMMNWRLVLNCTITLSDLSEKNLVAPVFPYEPQFSSAVHVQIHPLQIKHKLRIIDDWKLNLAPQNLGDEKPNLQFI